MKICNKCGINKDIIDFYKGRNSCKKCHYENMKQYKNNKAYKKYQKDYHIKCSHNGKKREYVKNNRHKIKNRYKIDPIFKMSCMLRSLIRNAYKDNGYKKNSKTFDILGCSFEDFKIYIENQFEGWMTWENNGIYTGNYNETWQLDHIQSIANANSIDEVIKLNHYTNFRPLCSRKNLEKSNKDTPILS